MDVNEELNFFVKNKKKNNFFFWGGGGWWGGWVRVDVKAMLGVGGDVGYGGCEPRVEGTVQGTKRYCILRKYLRTNGPVNAHLISWPCKAQNIQNLENIW